MPNCSYSYKILISSVLCVLLGYIGFSQQNVVEWKDEFNSTGDISIKKGLLLKISDYYLEVERQNDTVRKYLTSNINVSTDSLFYAELLFRKSQLYRNTSKFDQALLEADKSFELFGNFKEPYKQAKVKSLQGAIYQSMFKNKLALSSFDQANDVLQGNDRISLLSGYAAVYSQLNQLDKSIEYYNLAYQESIDNEYDAYLFNIHNGMASVYFKNDDKEKSKASLSKALKAAQNENYKLGQIVVLHNLGHQFYKEKNYDTAKSYFEEAIQLLNGEDHKLIEAQIYYKYADCLLISGNTELADDYAIRSRDIFKQLKSSGRLPYALRTMAHIEEAMGNNDEAISILNEAIEISSNNEISSITSELYLDLANNYKETDSSQKTFEAYQQHIRIKDSLNNARNSADIERVISNFEASERENLLKKDNEILSEQNKTSFYRNILLALGVIALIVFLLRQRHINAVKRKTLEQEKEISALNEKLLKDKVKSKNSQITEYAILIDERNKFIDQVTSQIDEIRALSSNSDQKKLINQLQYFIKDNVNVRREKIDLDKEVVENKEGFRFNLEQRFPKLTDKELTICRLLLLNLSSKQISQKMEITVQSVNNYRASIRKKVQLEKGDNLKRFLKNL